MTTSIYRTGITGAGDNSFALLPRDWSFDGAKPGVIFAFGYSDTASIVPDRQKCQPLLKAIVDAGHPVVVSDLGLDQWANDNAMTRFTAARTYLQGTIGAKAGKVALAGFSMGALNCLNWAASNPSAVLSIGGFCPVSDLANINTTYLASSITTAYGGAYSDAAFGATHNPTVRAAGGAYGSIPVKLWYSSDDPVIAPSTVTGLASLIGASASTVNVGALGHQWVVPTGKAADYVSFMTSHLT